MFDGWRKWRYIKPPLLPRLERMLQNVSPERKRAFYQSMVFVLMFITYATFHMNKRVFSIVKVVLSPNCNVTVVNNTCHYWKPFSNHKTDERIFSVLDFTFNIVYSVTLIASGLIAENTNLRIWLSFGMFMSGVASAVGGLIKYLQIHWLFFFFLLQFFTAITQSTGFPCVIEVLGMWFPKGRRGITYGIWSLSMFFGNIIGSAIIGYFASRDWGLSFMIPAIIIIYFSVIVYLILISEPDFVCITIKADNRLSSAEQDDSSQLLLKEEDENSTDEVNEEENTSIDKGKAVDSVQEVSGGISLWDALKIPGVVEYTICSFFSKLILYTFFFWLPYFIQSVIIQGKIFNPTSAAYSSIIFDLGGAFGGILAGVIFDYTDTPAIICVTMLILSVPCLYVFMTQLTYISVFFLFMFLSGCLITGPNLLIGTMAAAKLGSHESLQKNTKGIALVTAIFDSGGSIGAAVGPLLAGGIASSTKWTNVAYCLMFSALFAAASLLRQLRNEVRSFNQ